jgi:hypothetical protein
VKLSNIYVQHRGGGTKETAAIEPPEIETAYPEPGMFGPMPAHGFYIRHARNIEMRDVEIASLKEDARPAVVLNDVQGASISHLKIPSHGSDVPAMVLNNVQNFSIDRSKPVPDTELDRVDQRKLF